MMMMMMSNAGSTHDVRTLSCCWSAVPFRGGAPHSLHLECIHTVPVCCVVAPAPPVAKVRGFPDAKELLEVLAAVAAGEGSDPMSWLQGHLYRWVGARGRDGVEGGGSHVHEP